MATAPKTIPALRVRQWLAEWDKVRFDAKQLQSRPEPQFYLLSMDARDLKALTGVYRRSVKGGTARASDPNVQRFHDEERSEVIREFVRYGYPWCEMGEANRHLPDADELRKPGWIPTAILVNILAPDAVRNGVAIKPKDCVTLEDSGPLTNLRLPPSYNGHAWAPQAVFPLEVIDGQHRLWAFDNFSPSQQFDLPVVAFYDLDRAWQAYLFWSVNITPKKINRSLAFDLYPLLRQQTWLDRFTGHSIYRETRCQELVEALWAHPQSPWAQRINMLGEGKAVREYKGPTVSQAAWIRSLMSSFVKQWEGTGTRIGGLFGAAPTADQPVLEWTRPMQAAFLISAGQALRSAIEGTAAPWATSLRRIGDQDLPAGDDPAFYGLHSLLSTDQGIRGFLLVVNDLCFIESESLELGQWIAQPLKRGKGEHEGATDEHVVTGCIKSFSKTKASSFVADIAAGLATYDWRTSATPDLSAEERLRQAIFRGSSGYKEMRRALLERLSNRRGLVGSAARSVASALGYA